MDPAKGHGFGGGANAMMDGLEHCLLRWLLAGGLLLSLEPKIKLEVLTQVALGDSSRNLQVVLGKRIVLTMWWVVLFVFRFFSPTHPQSKKGKDPNAPKRPLSAYMLWLNANRDKIRSDCPGMSVTDVSKKAGELWKGMSKEKKEVGKEAVTVFHSHLGWVGLGL